MRQRPRNTWLGLCIDAMFAAIILWFAMGIAKPDQWSFKCRAYGRLVECKSVDVPDMIPLVFAAIHNENQVYQAAGNSFSFEVRDKSPYQIEMHVVDPKIEFPVLRVWAYWGKDPKDKVKKVLFSTTNPTESEASATSTSTTKPPTRER